MNVKMLVKKTTLRIFMVCVTCSYRETGCLLQQPDEAAAKFSSLLTRYSIKGKGKTIFNQGEVATGFYFLCKGLVKLTRVTEQGEEAILNFLAPCSIIGGVNAHKEKRIRVCSSVTAAELTEIAYLKKEDIPLLFQDYPGIGIGISGQMSERLRTAYKLIADMRLSVEDRVLALIARIMILLRGKLESIVIELPLSHRELAQFAQITPETLSRTLRILQDKGIISVEKKGLRVLQAEELRKYVDETN